MKPDDLRVTSNPSQAASAAVPHPKRGEAVQANSRSRQNTGGPWKVLRPYNPISWFHHRGIYRVLARLKPRLPDVSGSLFLTFTTNPNLYSCPSTAFEHAREKLRRIFYKLRQGVEWEGKHYVIDSPYAIKVEFHQNGWAHFHVIFLTRRYLPGELLTHLWGLGRTDVRRISNTRFHYLLKYVTKGGGLPAWVQERTRLRVFQASRDFYIDDGAEKKKSVESANPKKRAVTTIRERLKRWSHTALLGRDKEWEQVLLPAPFYELLNQLVYSIAVVGRYLGGGEIMINDTEDILQWIQTNPQ